MDYTGGACISCECYLSYERTGRKTFGQLFPQRNTYLEIIFTLTFVKSFFNDIYQAK